MTVTMSNDFSSPKLSALPKANLQSGRRSLAMLSISRDVSTPRAPGADEKPTPQHRSSTLASAGMVDRTVFRGSRPLYESWSIM